MASLNFFNKRKAKLVVNQKHFANLFLNFAVGFALKQNSHEVKYTLYQTNWQPFDQNLQKPLKFYIKLQMYIICDNLCALSID